MSNLKSQLIKLGSTNPELRPHIREVLSAMGKENKFAMVVNLAPEDFMEKLGNEVAANPPRGYVADEIFGIGRTNIQVQFKDARARQGFQNMLSISLSLKRDGYGVDILVTHMKDWESQPVEVMQGVERAATTMPVKKLAKDIQKLVTSKLRTFRITS